MNHPAKKSLQTQKEGLAITRKKSFSILDVQHKFRTMQIPKNSREGLQEKNLHKILNQGSALIYKDILEEEFNLNEKTHFQSFEQISKLERKMKGDQKGINFSENESSQDLMISNVEIDA
jgi:hypothetical protein